MIMRIDAVSVFTPLVAAACNKPKSDRKLGQKHRVLDVMPQFRLYNEIKNLKKFWL